MTELLPQAEQSCKNCKYKKNYRRRDGGWKYVCQRYAPTPHLASSGINGDTVDKVWIFWPNVLGSMWCGEWKPQEGDQ